MIIQIFKRWEHGGISFVMDTFEIDSADRILYNPLVTREIWGFNKDGEMISAICIGRDEIVTPMA